MLLITNDWSRPPSSRSGSAPLDPKSSVDSAKSAPQSGRWSVFG